MWGSRVVRMPAVVCCLLVAAGCGTPTDPPGSLGGLELGWTALPVAPYSPDLTVPAIFWAGDQLVVAGGFVSDTDDNVTFQSQTWSHSLETGAWTELDPFVIPGFDGSGLTEGVWTGQAWVGYALPCRNAPNISTPQGENCGMPMSARWSPDAGWSFGELPAQAYPDQLRTGTRPVGTTPTHAVMSVRAGLLTLDLQQPDAAWLFLPWPADAAPYGPGAASMSGDQIVVLASIYGSQDIPLGAGNEVPQTIDVVVLSIDGAVVSTRPLLQASGYVADPFCDNGIGFLFQPAPTDQIQRVEAEATTTLNAPVGVPDTERFEDPVPYMRVTDLNVGSGVVAFGPHPAFSYYLDTTTGRLEPLAPAPVVQTCWTGQVVLGQLMQPANEWFAFLRPPDWRAARGLEFPGD